MDAIKKTVQQLFGNQLPQAVASAKKRLAMPPDFGEALLSPSHREVVTMPEPVVITPAPEPQPVEVKPAPVVDADAERTDLPPRSPKEIARLIAAGETPEARGVRILNDKIRYLHQQGM
jgi:hypothetical protein